MTSAEKMPLRVLRVSANLTQEETARKLGVNRLTYSSWEKYKTFPDALQLMKLAEVFECSMDTFYFPHNANLELVK